MVKYAELHNIQVVSSYILWHAWQTMDDIKLEINEIIRYGRHRIPHFIANSTVKVMPGTPMENKLRRHNLLIEKPFDRGFNFKDKNVENLYTNVRQNFEHNIKPKLQNLSQRREGDIREVARLKMEEFDWFLKQLKI